MKYKFLAVLAALFVMAPVHAGMPRPGGTLKLATEGAFKPFNYYDKKVLKGFEVELGTALAKNLELKADWKSYPFDSLLIGLNEHKYDVVIASHGITPERAKAVDFSSPHYCGGGVIVSRIGGPKTVGDLKGKKVAVQVGTTWLQKIQEIRGVGEVKTYPKDTDALQNLLGGRADAWITDRFAAIETLKEQGKGKLQLGSMVFHEQIAMAVAKGDSELLKSLNAALFRMLHDGTYEKISMKYFGEDIRCKD
jgi:polar amino acid transport system substrate-binding protein